MLIWVRIEMHTLTIYNHSMLPIYKYVCIHRDKIYYKYIYHTSYNIYIHKMHYNIIATNINDCLYRNKYKHY